MFNYTNILNILFYIYFKEKKTILDKKTFTHTVKHINFVL